MRAWGPVLLWMLAIYVGSTDVLSSQHTSRFVGPILRWFSPNISDDAIRTAQFMLRKCGHLSEYAILALLSYRALAGSIFSMEYWNGRLASCALLVSAGYAVTDELHQSFVATRYGSALDVVIDSAGALTGLIALWLWHQVRMAGRSAPSGISEALGDFRDGEMDHKTRRGSASADFEVPVRPAGD